MDAKIMNKGVSFASNSLIINDFINILLLSPVNIFIKNIMNEFHENI